MGRMFTFKGFEKVGYLSTYAETTRRSLKKLENAFVKWNSEEQGGLLSKRVATNMVEFVRTSLFEQRYFKYTSLEPEWLRTKKKFTKAGQLKELIGIGPSKSLVRSLDCWSSGRGGYTMGIREETETPLERMNLKTGRMVKYGTYSSTQLIGWLLEVGSSVQVGRPWFGPAVMDYVRKEFPDDIAKTLFRDIRAAYRKFPKEVRVDEELRAENFVSTASLRSKFAGGQRAKSGRKLREVFGGEAYQTNEPALDTSSGGEVYTEVAGADMQFRYYLERGVKHVVEYWKAATKEWVKV